VELKLKAETRSDRGKGPVGRMRERGEVPAVMYGAGSEPCSLTVRREEITEVLHGAAGANALINLTVDGKSRESHLVMIKEIQRDPIKDRLLHLDFFKVARDEKVTAKIPIALIGEEESVGLKAGGTLAHNLWEVEVECLPADLPDHLMTDITNVQIGEHLTVGDLVGRSGVTILTDKGDTILTILQPRVLAAETGEGEAAEGETLLPGGEEAAAGAAEPGGEEAS